VVVDQIALDLARKALEAEEKKYKAGMSSTLNVAQQESYVAQARAASRTLWRRSGRRWPRSTTRSGSTLERYHIKLAYD
jgi:hypothetical protein